MKHLKKIFEEYSPDPLTQEDIEVIKEIFTVEILDVSNDVDGFPKFEEICGDEDLVVAIVFYYEDMKNVEFKLIQNFDKRLNKLGFYVKSSGTTGNLAITKWKNGE